MGQMKFRYAVIAISLGVILGVSISWAASAYALWDR